YPPDQWNIYAFHFSDGDNWGDDIPHCIEILTEKLLPKVNLFGYGQVESPYGSGEFYEYVHEMLGERDNVVCSRIPDRDAILGSMKEFWGTGRERKGEGGSRQRPVLYTGRWRAPRSPETTHAEHAVQHQPAGRPASLEGGDRGARPLLRAGLLRDDLRGGR